MKPRHAIAREMLYLGFVTLALHRALAASGDENWDGRFRLPGINGTVKAVVVRGASLYYGGDFDFAGGIEARSIVRWDGTEWSALGRGVEGTVNALVAHDGQLYAAGRFVSAGGVSATNIARWDGIQWHAVGPGLSDTVNTLASNGAELFAGGAFRFAGTNLVNLVARWDGARWWSLGEGIDAGGDSGVVHALAAEATILYAGGSFSRAGSADVTHVATWDGHAWSAPGAPLFHNAVYTLALSGGRLFAGGSFEENGGIDALATWDGNAWSGMGLLISSRVACILVNGPALYVGAFPGILGHTNGWLVFKLEGGVWTQLALTLPSSWWENPGVAGLVMFQGNLCAGGTFNHLDGVVAKNVARHNGSQWLPLDDGPANGIVLDTDGLLIDGSAGPLAVSGSNVYVAGTLLFAGGTPATNLARWDGTNWSAIPCALAGSIRALAATNGLLYVGGHFSSIGGVAALNIAKWDGTNWSALGSGLDDDSFSGSVSSLLLRGQEVIAGGRFTHAGAVPALNVARWDGTNWSGFGQGLVHLPSGWGEVNALAAEPDRLYAAGFITHSGDTPVTGLAQWDGRQWSGVGGNPPLAGLGFFNALGLVGRNLYVGGTSLFAESAGGSYVARWDGINWSGLGNGVTHRQTGYGSVTTLAAAGADLYVAGQFDTAGGQPAPGVARWDGRTWSPLGSGIAPSGISRLAASRDLLFACGNFSNAGGQPASSFAVWHIPPRLDYQLANGMLQLSWPTQAVGYVLQTATKLPTTSWGIAPAPAPVGSRYVVTNAITGTSSYFRLAR